MEPERKRFLMLDSDIILAGPILDILEKYDEDWIVYDEPFTQEDLYKWYFDPAKIKELDPDFNFPNYTFNTGQLVGFTGMLKREDFNNFIEWKEPRIQLHREAFTFGGEQPLLNYLLMKKQDKKEISLRRLNFMRGGLNAETKQLSIDRIKRKEGYPFIIHWHDKKPGIMHPTMEKIPRNDVLLYFEDIYYRKAGISPTAQYLRIRSDYTKDKILKSISKMLANNDGIKSKLKSLLGK
jgi:hypothetical protein